MFNGVIEQAGSWSTKKRTSWSNLIPRLFTPRSCLASGNILVQASDVSARFWEITIRTYRGRVERLLEFIRMTKHSYILKI